MPNHRCDHCKQVAYECYGFGDLNLCPTCVRLYEPPKLMLLTNDIGNTIWNIEVGKYESVDNISIFGLCGWFERSTQEFVYNIVPRTVVTIHHFEYYGDLQCCRCRDYQYFDPSATICEAAVCADFTRKRKPEERNYPQRGSKYYEYIKNLSA